MYSVESFASFSNDTATDPNGILIVKYTLLTHCVNCRNSRSLALIQVAWSLLLLVNNYFCLILLKHDVIQFVKHNLTK